MRKDTLKTHDPALEAAQEQCAIQRVTAEAERAGGTYKRVATGHVIKMLGRVRHADDINTIDPAGVVRRAAAALGRQAKAAKQRS